MSRRIRPLLARIFLCRFGFHTKAMGIGFDACGRSCGHVRAPDAAKRYEVVLITGERFEVKAVNEFHAGSIVVYGSEGLSMDQFGKPLGTIKVHRENIKTVRMLSV
ncbi:hypothetical protein [Herbaspirillum sp. RV1423]|uniref:hypothetical protein n=1 Tax=Herbaspirillum sp. RV1423 TaxID=1443993 RepID=UPI0012DE39C6|nr:hypothetical protein [Herbaspirillum sp. RV1423]